MNIHTRTTLGAAAATLALLAPSLVLAADVTTTAAGATVPATAETKISAKMDRQRMIGAKEIDRRVAALNALVTRINDLKRLNADAKTSVTTSLNTQAQALTALKAKIAADTDEATLKTDVQSITDAYRVFALVLPQSRIVIMSDSIVYVADAMLTVGSKLDARIKAAEAAGKDVTALKTALADLGTKATDAKTQAQNAVSLIANLTPDQGDKTKMAENTKALNDARAKLKAGRDDLTAARADVMKITTALKGMKLDAASTATPSASGAAGAGTPGSAQ